MKGFEGVQGELSGHTKLYKRILTEVASARIGRSRFQHVKILLEKATGIAICFSSPSSIGHLFTLDTHTPPSSEKKASHAKLGVWQNEISAFPARVYSPISECLLRGVCCLMLDACLLLAACFLKTCQTHSKGGRRRPPPLCGGGRRPTPVADGSGGCSGTKQQALSNKQQAASKHRASSCKHQAQSNKH